jgi:hypothetical protein
VASRETEWTYANNGRIAFVFMAFAVILLVLGLLAVVSFGSDAATGGSALLTIAIFLLVFTVLVFLPRLVRRGAVSFSVYSRRSIDEVEKAVRDAMEAVGRTPQVERIKSRLGRPPRIVTAEGSPARFRIEATRHPPANLESGEWTEIVESFLPREAKEAQALRDKVTERLGRAPPPDA